METLKSVTTASLSIDWRSLIWSQVLLRCTHLWVTWSMISCGWTSEEMTIENQTMGSHNPFFLDLWLLRSFPWFPQPFSFEDVAVAKNFDVSTQFCHIGRDFSFGDDVLLLGIWVQGVRDDKLWINHLRVGDEDHQGLSKFIKGCFTLECNSQLYNRTRVRIVEGIQKCGGFGRWWSRLIGSCCHGWGNLRSTGPLGCRFSWTWALLTAYQLWSFMKDHF